MKKLILFLVAFWAAINAKTIPKKEYDNMVNSVQHYFQSEEMAQNLESIFNELAIRSNEVEPSSSNSIQCFACKMVTGYLNKLGEQKEVQSFVVNKVIDVCNALHKYAPYVCDNLIPNFKNEFFYLVNNLLLSPNEVCGYILGPSCAKFYNPYSNWTIPIPPKSPSPPRRITPIKGDAPLKVLHLTDLHHDPHYVVGSNADCSQPLCCRAINGFPSDPTKKAGKWGDYRYCDIPMNTLKNMLGNINKSHHVDFIFWTGDFPPHDDWFQNRTTQLQSVQTLTDLLLEYFPNVPVFPALGNHESNPVNSFPQPSVTGSDSIQWLYEKLNTTWTNWLDADKVSQTIIKGAYYAISPYPGYKIISLNMNYCNSMNWWLLTNMTDPADELTWFAGELLKAEQQNEVVHILGHIPPDACPKVWGHNYNNIIIRFKDIIKGAFFGHTHQDQLHIHYEGSDSKNKEATTVIYVGPSGTTYQFLNPAYRIYDVDGGKTANRSWDILDHHNYFLNITEANLLDKPTWRLEYSAKSAYGMQSLSPQEWDKVVENMKTNKTLFELYYLHKYHKSDVIADCDETCRKETICGIQSAVNNKGKFC